MTEQAQYTPDELKEMTKVLVGGSMPECPRCHIHLTERPIGGGSYGLGYARKREWLICPRCRRSAIYDIRRGTRN
jgi:hypothetical protein